MSGFITEYESEWERRWNDPDDILHTGFDPEGRWCLCEVDHEDRDKEPCTPIT